MLYLTLASGINLLVFAGCSVLWCRADVRTRRIPNQLLIIAAGSFAALAVVVAVLLLVNPPQQTALTAAGAKWVTAGAAGVAVTVLTVLLTPAAVGRGDLKLLGLLVMQLLWYGSIESIAVFLVALALATAVTVMLSSSGARLRGAAGGVAGVAVRAGGVAVWGSGVAVRGGGAAVPAGGATTAAAARTVAYAPALTAACWLSLAATWIFR